MHNLGAASTTAARRPADRQPRPRRGQSGRSTSVLAGRAGQPARIADRSARCASRSAAPRARWRPPVGRPHPRSAAATAASRCVRRPDQRARRDLEAVPVEEPVSVSPAPNAGWRSTRTSRSRLVRHAVDAGPGERAGQGRGRLGPVRRPGDHLGQHRVVVHADQAAVVDAGVHPHAAGVRQPARSGANSGQLAGMSRRCRIARRRPPARGRVLGVQARLDRVAAAGSGARSRQPAAGRDQQLERDQVEPGRALGDRVLDLEPGVHLQEPEAPVGQAGTRPCPHRCSRRRGPRRRPRRTAGRAGPAPGGRAARAPPRRSSGAAAGSSTRAPPAPARCRTWSAIICTSTCRPPST